MAAGNFLGGYLTHNFGGSTTFRICGMIMFVSCIVHIALRLLEQNCCSNKIIESEDGSNNSIKTSEEKIEKTMNVSNGDIESNEK